MKGITAACLLSLALLCAGCTSTRPSPVKAAPGTELVSLDEAKSLMVSGQVKEIFQPHVGCVILTLRDGRLLSFDQPYLDWVVHFVRDSKLEGKIDSLGME